MAEITAPGLYPDANGFTPEANSIIYIVNGTTIAGVLEFQTKEGNWVTVPDVNSYSTIAADWMYGLKTSYRLKYRLNLSTVTGTWDWDYNKENQRAPRD